MFPQPIQVQALKKYIIKLKYSDGVNGEVNLSHLSKQGIFKSWDFNNLFNKVYIDDETDAIAWNNEIELCPDALYLKIINLSFTEWKNKKYSYATN